MTHGRKIWLSYRAKTSQAAIQEFTPFFSILLYCTFTSCSIPINLQHESIGFWHFSRGSWHHNRRDSSRKERGRNTQQHLVDGVWKSSSI